MSHSRATAAAAEAAGHRLAWTIIGRSTDVEVTASYKGNAVTYCFKDGGAGSIMDIVNQVKVSNTTMLRSGFSISDIKKEMHSMLKPLNEALLAFDARMKNEDAFIRETLTCEDFWKMAWSHLGEYRTTKATWLFCIITLLKLKGIPDDLMNGIAITCADPVTQSMCAYMSLPNC